AGGASTSAAAYDPARRTWSSTGSLKAARCIHTAPLLQSRMLLVAGGVGFPDPSASAELCDPASGSWTATGNLNIGRYLHMATLLQNGMVLVAGGLDSNGNPLASAELDDPAS